MPKYVPKKGDIVWINFDPQAGHEQAAKRPALVLSKTSYNQKVGMALFCPITSQTKGYPFEVVIPKGLKTSGVVLSDHIKSFDWRARKAKFIEEAPDLLMDEVIEKFQTLII